MMSKMEMMEKEQKEVDRIKRLAHVRQDTRKRFFTRQKERENLEQLSGTKEKVLPD